MKVFFSVLLSGLIIVYFISISFNFTKDSNLENNFEHIDAISFKEKIENTEESLLLDIRTPQEFNNEKIPNSRLLNIYDEDNFRAEMNTIARDTPIYMYCRSSTRSKNAMTILRSMGFENVIGLDGGINSWKNQGFTVTTN